MNAPAPRISPTALATNTMLLSWLPMTIAVISAGVAVSIALMPFPHQAAERRLCDQAVDALVHSKDLVEVERAGIIIRELDCAIGRRLNTP